jgi:hypothetical protein
MACCCRRKNAPHAPIPYASSALSDMVTKNRWRLEKVMGQKGLIAPRTAPSITQ